jgi:LPXTG-motif cell wall-anchored protein
MSAAMAAVGSLLNSAAVLTKGATVKIASVSAASTFTGVAPPVQATPVTAPSHPAALPHTGGDPGLAVLGVVLAALSLGVIRWRRLVAERTQSTTVR